MSEQWYCPNCGIVGEDGAYNDKPQGELVCDTCHYLLSHSPPKCVLAMQKRIEGLEKNLKFCRDVISDADEKVIPSLEKRISTTEDSLAQRWETINCQDSEIDEYKKRISLLEKVAEAVMTAKKKYPAITTQYGYWIPVDEALRAAGYLGEDG